MKKKLRQFLALLLTGMLLVQSMPMGVLASEIPVGSAAAERSAMEDSPAPEKTEEPSPEPSAKPMTPAVSAYTEEPQTVTADEGKTTVEKTVHSADGTDFTVKVRYDASSELPEGTELSVKELVEQPSQLEMTKPENRNRPFDTEMFAAGDALAEEIAVLSQGLDLEQTDALYYAKFLDLSLTRDGQPVEPKAPVEITIETEDMDVTLSDGGGDCPVRPQGPDGTDQVRSSGGGEPHRPDGGQYPVQQP